MNKWLTKAYPDNPEIGTLNDMWVKAAEMLIKLLAKKEKKDEVRD